MIYQKQVYACKCDGCGETFGAFESDEIHFDEKQNLEDLVKDDDEWHTTEDGKHYCHSCWSYDDDDNLVFKSPAQS